MKTVLLGFSLLLGIWGVSFGQIEPYYELPPERSSKDVTAAFPNLSVGMRKLYLRPEAGLTWGRSKLADGDASVFTPVRLLDMTWGAYIGYNADDKWMAEVGYVPHKRQQRTLLKTPYFDYPVVVQYDSPSLALRFQRQLFTLDRVSKSTRMFFTSGLHMNLGDRNRLDTLNRGILVPSTVGSSADTLTVTGSTSLKKAAAIGEIGIELRGRLIPQLEIGVCYKIYVQPPNSLTTNVSWQQTGLGSHAATITSKLLSQYVGVGLHYNFALFKKYKPNI